MELVALAYSAAEMDLLIILPSADLTKNLEKEYRKRVRSKSWKHFWIYSENERIWQRIYR